MRFLSCRLYQSWDKKGDTSRIIKKDCFSHISPLGYYGGDNQWHMSLLYWAYNEIIQIMVCISMEIWERAVMVLPSFIKPLLSIIRWAGSILQIEP